MADRARPDGPGELGAVHVLVVDDAPEILELIVEILQGGGARVTSADTAEQALALLERSGRMSF